MDADATWKQLSEAFGQEDQEAIDELAKVLLDWLAKDGFPPKITGNKEFDYLVAYHTCDVLYGMEY